MQPSLLLAHAAAADEWVVGEAGASDLKSSPQLTLDYKKKQISPSFPFEPTKMPRNGSMG